MQQTNTAIQARKPKAAAIPALMPLPCPTNVIFWVVAALNDDAELQAIEALQKGYKSTPSTAMFTTLSALKSAKRLADDQCKRSFRICRDEGALPFAWRGSRALVQVLPSSLRGAA